MVWEIVKTVLSHCAVYDSILALSEKQMKKEIIFWVCVILEEWILFVQREKEAMPYFCKGMFLTEKRKKSIFINTYVCTEKT